MPDTPLANLHPAQRMSENMTEAPMGLAGGAHESAALQKDAEENVGVLRYSSIPTNMKDPVLVEFSAAIPGLNKRTKNAPYFQVLNHS